MSLEVSWIHRDACPVANVAVPFSTRLKGGSVWWSLE